MMCARCAELEEQLAYYKSEAGFSYDRTTYALLRQVHRLTPMEAKFLCVLHDSRRVMNRWQLVEVCDSQSVDSVDVYATRIRRRLGQDAIITHWGQGWSIGPAGKAAVKAARAGLAA